MPYYNEQDLEDFVDYLDNDTQTEDLSDSEDEIEEIEMDEKDEKAMIKNVKFFEETGDSISFYQKIKLISFKIE